ncbi:hypothetical protein LC55x_5279 [Lysobacter capsici]|nr:hypothetical protein LC55x_5279 [Lysobacter capsici]
MVGRKNRSGHGAFLRWDPMNASFGEDAKRNLFDSSPSWCCV